MLIAGASSPCSPTSNRAGLASNRPISNIPTASPPEPVEGLILVMSLALYWALSTEMWGQANNQIPRRKKRPDCQPAKLARGRLSWFTRGLRRAIKLLLECLPLPEALGMPVKLIDAQSPPYDAGSAVVH